MKKLTVVDHLPVNQRVEETPYPKAGQPNPQVKVGVVSAGGGTVRWADLDNYTPTASLITRGLKVDIVAPEKIPLERVLGAELGGLVKKVHEDKGVTFHLGQTVKSAEEKSVVLDDGSRLSADIVIAGPVANMYDSETQSPADIKRVTNIFDGWRKRHSY